MATSTNPGARRALSPEERRRRNREEMTDAILAAAREVMREEGVAALNMHEVARRVGLRTQSLYHYFSSKAALYDALFLLGTRLLAEQQDNALQGKTDVWERVQAAMEGYMGFAQQHPELWRLTFERPVPGFVPSEESMEESDRLLATARRQVAEAIEAGAMEPGLTPAEATDFINSLMHGLTAAHMANEPHLPAGTGRFGGLLPAAVAFLRAAWGPRQHESYPEEPGG